MTQRRLLLAVGMAGYGPRAELFQADMQRGLSLLLDRAADGVGLRRDAWTRQPRRDGEFAVLPEDGEFVSLPAGGTEDRVVYRFVQELNAGLTEYNRTKAEEARLRLRLALHFGPASPVANGFSGSGPVVVEQLCGSRPVRESLELSGASLAVVLSEVVYTDTVRSLRVPVLLQRIRRIRIHEDDWAGEAWLWLPGHDANDLQLTDGLPLPGEPKETSQPKPKSKKRPKRKKKPEPRVIRVEYFKKATTYGPAIAGGSHTHHHGEQR